VQRTSVEDKIARTRPASARAPAKAKDDDEDGVSEDGASEDGASEDDASESEASGMDDDDDIEEEDDAEDTIRLPRAAGKGKHAQRGGGVQRGTLEQGSDEDDEDAVDEAEEARKRAYFRDAPEGAAATTFASMQLSRPILLALSELGFTTPTPVQARTIPLALQGLDLCASAVTGSGTSPPPSPVRSRAVPDCGGGPLLGLRVGIQARRRRSWCPCWSDCCSARATCRHHGCWCSPPRASWPSNATWSRPSSPATPTYSSLWSLVRP
jgi:hypothetical protein